jgi:signal peptidase I
MRLLGRLVRLLAPALVAAALYGAAAPFAGAVLIAGGSMEPALHPGDVLVYSRRVGTLATNDVVVIEKASWRRPVVHRVVGRGASGGFVTQGDANPIPDREEVTTADVRGRGLAVLPLSRAVRRLAVLAASARLLLQSKTAR